MAKLRADENGSGANRDALEELVAEVQQRFGEVPVQDRVLIQRARTLASAVDADPANSQLEIQYGLVVKELRSEVLSVEDDRFNTAMWRIQTGCTEHDRGEVHCASCCASSSSVEDIEGWEPPPRHVFEGRSAGLPYREVDDEEYARRVVGEFLRQRHLIRW